MSVARRAAKLALHGRTASTCDHCGVSIGRARPDGSAVFKSANRGIVVTAEGAVKVRCGKCGELTGVPLVRAGAS